jgi:membrane associated rhomboid family serine protease
VWLSEYASGSTQALFLAHGFVPAHPSLATAFTSMFLHAGFWHLAGNVFFFWMFGNKVENLFGPWLFASTYLLSGFGATAFYYALNQHSPITCVWRFGSDLRNRRLFSAAVPEDTLRTDLLLWLYSTGSDRD